MAFVEGLEAAYQQVLAASGASVVRIGRGPGRGAGIVIGEGQVVTNAHNLRDRTTTVTFADGRAAQGVVAGVDSEGDLVVLSVDTAGAQPVGWPEAQDALVPGRIVFALSLPAGGGTRITSGPVSATDRSFRGPRGRLLTGGIEHTAPLRRGSSGGPLLDASGQLVGINTHRLGDGFYAALPATAALRDRLARLGRGETPEHLRLGVALAPSVAARKLRAAVGLPERDGLLVRGVEDGSPAATAGLARGDLIVAAGGRPVGTVDDLQRALDGALESRQLVLGVVRGVEDQEFTVTFP